MAVTPAQRLQVAAGSGGAMPEGPARERAPAPEADPEAAPAPLDAASAPAARDARRIPLMVAAMLVLIAVVAAAWAFGRRRASPRGDAGRRDTRRDDVGDTPLEDLRAACGANDPRAARRALERWRAASRLDPEQRRRLEVLLGELDQALYGPAGSAWDGGPLASFVRDVARNRDTGRRSPPRAALPPLHPSG
jgi:hypothetical protein